MIDGDNPHLSRQPPPDMVQCDRYIRLSRRDPWEPGAEMLPATRPLTLADRAGGGAAHALIGVADHWIALGKAAAQLGQAVSSRQLDAIGESEEAVVRSDSRR